jgi:hypothetical protein
MTNTRLLDDEDELYGYGLINVRNLRMIAPVGKDLFKHPERAEKHLENLVESGSVRKTDHIRMVQVRLDNENDKRLEEIDQ